MTLINQLSKSLFVSSLLVFFSFITNAQPAGNGEIVSEGIAKIKIQPDIACLTFRVEKRDSIEKNVIAELNKEIVALSGMLSRLGIKDEEIKISDYEISSSDSRYDNTETKIYNASNSLKLEFKLNAKLIDAIYSGIHENAINDVDIEFETKLSDSLDKATRYVLVQKAIADAKANANNIARTLNLKLTKVKQVLKRNESYQAYPMETNMLMFTEPRIEEIKEDLAITSFSKYKVEDIELEEKITIVYESSK